MGALGWRLGRSHARPQRPTRSAMQTPSNESPTEVTPSNLIREALPGAATPPHKTGR
jgi:hypothetical protein